MQGRRASAVGVVSHVERFFAVALCASVLTVTLFVARNRLAPTQGPWTFGLVFWATLAAFYGAIGVAAGGFAWLAARWARRPEFSRRFLGVTAACFLATALYSNRRATGMLFALGGPDRFRWLAPAAFLLAGVALGALALRRWERPGLGRVVTLLACLACLGALWPTPGPPPQRAETVPRLRRVSTHPPLLVVGVDGADWTYLEPLIARGDVPHLARLRDRGAWGALRTFRPTLSPVVWTTVATGKRPLQHGVRGFTAPRLRGVEQSLPGLHPVRGVGFVSLHRLLVRSRVQFESPVTSLARRVAAFWNLNSGAYVNVINWWATWPAERIQGYMVSERTYFAAQKPRHHPGGGGDRLTFPRALYGQIRPRVMRVQDVTLAHARTYMDVTAEEWNARRDAADETDVRGQFGYFYSMFVTHRRLASELTRRGQTAWGQVPDLLVLFRLVDKTCHTSLRHSELVRDHLGADAAESARFSRVVTQAYRDVDAALGELLELYPDAHVIVLSDHGFTLETVGGRSKYNHFTAPDGIFIASGPAVRPGRVEGLSVIDVLPLMAYLKGLPIAEDLPGKLPEELLRQGQLRREPARRTARYGRRSQAAFGHGDREVEDQMIERLRALGYVQ